MSPFTIDGTENRMRWDRTSSGFMEAWYLTINHRDSGSGVWLRYTLLAPRRAEPYCELWALWFDPDGKRNFAGKVRLSIDALGSSNGRDDGALVRIGSAWLSESHAEGELTHGERVLTWSLDFEPADRCFQHLPARVRRTVEKRISTICAPNLSVPFSGSVTVDDELFTFDGDRGYQGHRWGKRHSLSWAWAHCSSWEGGESAVFEGVAARSSIGFVFAPTLTFVHLGYDGEDIAFNDLKWAIRARSRYEMPTWAFTAHNDDYRITGAARTSIDRLMQVTYTDPDGSPRYCANSEIGDLGLELYRRDGSVWRHVKSLTALRTAHVEFGRREPFVELPIAL
jgi:Tocopherol cyclase